MLPGFSGGIFYKLIRNYPKFEILISEYNKAQVSGTTIISMNVKHNKSRYLPVKDS
jgi:hypothetical protein